MAAASRRLAAFNEFKDATKNAWKNVGSLRLKVGGKPVNDVAPCSTPMMVWGACQDGSNSSNGSPPMLALLNGVPWGMNQPLAFPNASIRLDSLPLTLSFIDWEHPTAKNVFWHSSAHLLGRTLESRFETCRLGTGPAKESGGFFYDAFIGTGQKSRSISRKELSSMQEDIQQFAGQCHPFEMALVSKSQAMDMFSDNGYKLSILQNLRDEEIVSVVGVGDFVDLCRGPHLSHSGVVGAVQLISASAAFWKGDNSNDQLQRVFGISAPSTDALDRMKEHEQRAQDNDHRSISKQQSLFFSNNSSPGNVFFPPKGTRLLKSLEQIIRAEYNCRNYQEVVTPNVFSQKLWETSGHWQHYKDDMFLLQQHNSEVEQPSIDNQEQSAVSSSVENSTNFGLKPMNCPAHCIVFASEHRTHRDLPMRLAEFAALHRNELSGALGGLTRLRRFVQDDAHLFCSVEGIQAEVDGCLEMVQTIYNDLFQFEYSLKLSTRPDSYQGSLELWDRAEEALRAALDRTGKAWELNAGDGAFYGPKIDLAVQDSFGRSHQCGTIQLDFSLPERFDLQFANSDNEMTRPVIVHRAILGSLERFLGLLIEHWQGKWPAWMAPVQVAVFPVRQEHVDACAPISSALSRAGVSNEVLSKGSLNKRLRTARKTRIPLAVIVGDEEASTGTGTASVLQVEGCPWPSSISQDQCRPLADLVKDIQWECTPPNCRPDWPAPR